MHMSIMDLISVLSFGLAFFLLAMPSEKITLKENDRPTLGSLAVILTNK